MTVFTWRGAGGVGQSGTWGAPADWAQPGGPPGPRDTAIFRGGAGVNAVTGGGTIDRFESFNSGVRFTGSLTFLGTTGIALTAVGGGNEFDGSVTAPTIVLTGTKAGGLLTLFGGQLTAGNVVIDGQSPFASFGSEVMFDGRERTQHISVTAAAGSSTTLEVFAGGTWTNSGSVVVGGDGSGVLNVEWGLARIGYQGGRGNLLLGSVANGSGTATVAATLEVANLIQVGAGGTGSLLVQEGGLAHAGALHVDGGSSVTLGGFNESRRSFAKLTLGSGTIDAGGTIQGAGELVTHRGIVNDGTIAATGFLDVRGNVIDQAAIDIGSGAAVRITSDLLGTGTIVFAIGGNADLVIGEHSTIDPTLTGFAAGDELRALGVDSVRYDAGSGHLTLLSGGVADGVLTLAGSYAANGFHVTAQGQQGVITYGGGVSHTG